MLGGSGPSIDAHPRFQHARTGTEEESALLGGQTPPQPARAVSRIDSTSKSSNLRACVKNAQSARRRGHRADGFRFAVLLRIFIAS